LETAFRLAIDIGDYDLFISIYHLAKTAKNSELARAAKEKADEMSDDVDSESSSSKSLFTIAVGGCDTRMIFCNPIE